jgi:GMP synthase (glutamine-hydrolysing)
LLVININPKAATRSGTRALVRKFKQLCAHTVIVRERHFLRIRLESLKNTPPSALIIGPQGVPFDAYPAVAREHLFALLKALTEPALAVCGGHQALALAHGSTVGPVFGGSASESYDGMDKEVGFRTITRAENDPILGAVPQLSRMYVSHVEEVQSLPPGFRLLATGDPCRIQLMKATQRAIYGCQFHPEKGGDGTSFLRAFLTLANIPTR